MLVVVSGHPASGKSTVARSVSMALALPLVTKDGVKETLLERLGAADREWSRRLGVASWDVLYYVAGVLMAATRPFILEGNFDPRYARPILDELVQRHGYGIVELFCTAPVPVLQSRFRERALSGDRHAGHGDACHLDEFLQRLEEPVEPLTLGPVLTIDTSSEAPDAITARAVSWIRRREDGAWA